MAQHTLLLNYGTAGLKPDPDPVLVKTGDTILFQVIDVPSDTTFRITIAAPAEFSPSVVTDSNTPVTVVKAVETTYTCELIGETGVSLFKSNEGEGGHVRPG